MLPTFDVPARPSLTTFPNQPPCFTSASAVAPRGTILFLPERSGTAPAHSGAVSRCALNSSRGPWRVPGNLTIKLPVCATRKLLQLLLSLLAHELLSALLRGTPCAAA